MKTLTLPFAVVLTATLAAQEPQQPKSLDEFFGLDKIWDIHITVAEGAWKAMMPDEGSTFGFTPQRAKMPFVKVQMEIAGYPAIPVGIRYKGNSSFSASRGTLKRPFKVDFDRYVKKQTFLGLKKINMQNASTDGTQIKQAICYDAFAKAGIPSPKTAFARVYLTLKGKTKRAYLGLYTLVEQTDRGFLRRRYGGKAGTILKPEVQIFGYYGEEWNAEYERTYIPKTKVSKKHQELLLRMAGLAHDARTAQRNRTEMTEAQKESFAKAVEKVIDIDNFLRYAAMNAILKNWDNPLTIAHNVYFVIPDGVDRLLFSPWDLNLALQSRGGFGGFGSQGVLNPAGRLAFSRAIFGVERFKKRYRTHVEELIKGPCSAKALTAVIERVKKTTAKAIADEANRDEVITRAFDAPSTRGRFGGGMFRRGSDLVAFAKQNEQAVLDELAGKMPARRSSNRFGGFGGGNQRGGFGGFGQREGVSGTMRNVLVAGGVLPTDADANLEKVVAATKAAFAKLDKNGSHSLEVSELRAAVQVHLDKQRQGGRRNAFSSGAGTLSRDLRRDLDKDRDGSLSPAEWEAGAKKWFAAWDRNRDGVLKGSEFAPPSSRRRR